MRTSSRLGCLHLFEVSPNIGCTRRSYEQPRHHPKPSCKGNPEGVQTDGKASLTQAASQRTKQRDREEIKSEKAKPLVHRRSGYKSLRILPVAALKAEGPPR